MVVIARHDHRLAPGSERGADLAQHRLGDAQRLADGALPQLEYIAEQHEPVAAKHLG